MAYWRIDIVQWPAEADSEHHTWEGEAASYGEALGKAWGEATKTTIADALQSAADKLRGGT